MANRLDLHETLCDILGSRNVYYQKPDNLHMKYPAIVYSKTDILDIFANDGKYISNARYDVTVIDYLPDSEITNRVLELPKSSYDRQYISDDLYHDTLTLYW